MERIFTSYPAGDNTEIRSKMLNWSKRFSIFCLLDNHQYHFAEPAFECLLAAGSLHSLECKAGNAFAQLQQFATRHPDWIFGHLAYDLKNEVEEVVSRQPDHIHLPDLFFFVPETVLVLKQGSLLIGSYGNPDEIYDAIQQAEPEWQEAYTPPALAARFTRDEYIDTVEKLRGHILRGDCYEINFCQELYAEHCRIDPHAVYDRLSRLSPSPFAAFYKLEDKYLLCSSPERYLKKKGQTLMSQPIKGTASRNLRDEADDARRKEMLAQSAKELAENVMVVDLVRNDLSRICRDGTVKAEELFGIYTFPQVHQMISTVTGRLEENAGLADIFRATFPMGSMTGAPKKSVMQLIEKYERTRRGLFSGAFGYIDPGGDFDFNVVIRSILYNSSRQYLSLQAGSAITFYSDPAKEFDECMLKMEAMKQVLR